MWLKTTKRPRYNLKETKMEIKSQKNVSLPVEGIPNLWIVYNEKAAKSREENYLLLYH